MKLSDEELLTKMTSFYLTAEEDSDSERKMIKKTFDFKLGRQWEDPITGEDLKKTLEAAGKYAITYNLIAPRLDLLSGVLSRTRTEPVFVPRTGGTAAGAKLLTEILKHTRDLSRAEYLEAHVFDDGNTCGQGWYMAQIELTDDPFGGQIVLDRLSPVDVYVDAACSNYDLNRGARFVIVCFWADKDDAQHRFPKKAKELGEMFDSIGKTGGVPTVWGNDNLYNHHRDDVIELKANRNRHKGMTCFWKTYETEDRLVDNTTLDWLRIGKDISQEEVAVRVTSDPVRFMVVPDVAVPKLHRTTFIGGVLARDDEEIMGGITKYPVFRYCPKWTNSETPGLVEGAMDPQRELNKRISQALYKLNQSANSGFQYRRGTLTEGQRTVYEEFGSKPGVMLESEPDFEMPKRLEPAQLSVADMELAREAAFRISEIMGVNTESMGFEAPRKESGIAIQERKEAGLTVNEPIFRNFRMTQEICTESLCEIVRKTDVYSDDEIEMIAESAKDVPPEAIRDWRLGHYSISITHRAATPSERAANLQALLEVNKAIPGVIPPETIIEATDLPNKDEIVDGIEQMRTAQAQGVPGTVEGAPR